MKNNGEEVMKEINKVYRYLEIDKRMNNPTKIINGSEEKISLYDNNKKSYLDNKTGIRARYRCYGGLE